MLQSVHDERGEFMTEQNNGTPGHGPWVGQPYPEAAAFYGRQDDPSRLARSHGQGGPAQPAGPVEPRAGQWPHPGGAGHPQPYAGPYPALVPKSVALAVLLSFLWLGVGHLYAERTGPGIALLCAHFFLIFLSFFIITLIITIPAWLILAPIAMITSASAVREYNVRLGYR